MYYGTKLALIIDINKFLLFFSLNRRWAFCSIAARALSLCSRSSREGSSFLCPNKETKQRNSPSALFCLLRHFSPLNKKNSRRSNSFLFFTLRNAPPLHGKKVRPDLCAFFSNIATLVGSGVFSFFCFTCCSLMISCFASLVGSGVFSRSFTTLRFALDDKEMNSRAKRRALLEGYSGLRGEA